MPEDAVIKVLLVDDDPGVQQFVSHVLRGGDYTPLAATDGDQALQMAAEHRPSLVVLDLSLPRLSGLEVCTRLRSWYEGPILVLSATEDERAVVEALDRGADDYLTKPFRPAEFLARTRALLRRAATKTEEIMGLEAGGVRIDLARRRVEAGSGPVRLTRTEFDILALLVRNQERVTTSESILRTVWGPYHGEYSQSLRVHIGHIRKKLEHAGATEGSIITEPGVGYRFTTETSNDHATAAAS